MTFYMKSTILLLLLFIIMEHGGKDLLKIAPGPPKCGQDLRTEIRHNIHHLKKNQSPLTSLHPAIREKTNKQRSDLESFCDVSDWIPLSDRSEALQSIRESRQCNASADAGQEKCSEIQSRLLKTSANWIAAAKDSQS